MARRCITGSTTRTPSAFAERSVLMSFGAPDIDVRVKYRVSFNGKSLRLMRSRFSLRVIGPHMPTLVKLDPSRAEEAKFFIAAWGFSLEIGNLPILAPRRKIFVPHPKVRCAIIR
jgi:hypothetical protein